jgi:hypothetical protein
MRHCHGIRLLRLDVFCSLDGFGSYSGGDWGG